VVDFEIDVKKPHDSFFKGIFGDVSNTRDFLKSYLPQDLVKKINFDRITISDTEKEDVEYNKSYFDLSVLCEINSKPSQIYIIFEHKSYKDKLTLIQILSYCLVMWEKEINDNKKNLTPIIPFIFYHGNTKSGFHTNFRDYFNVADDLKKYLLNFEMILFDTATITDDEIKKEVKNLYLISALLIMKNIHKKADDMKDIFEHILNLDDERTLLLWRYIITKKDMTETKFDEIMIELKGEKMKSIAEIWQERDELRGELRGRLEEIYKNIKSGLEIKFDKVDKKLLLSIQKIQNLEKLEKILNKLFIINDIDKFKTFVQETIDDNPKKQKV
jgi:predicted transposase YdaD